MTGITLHVELAAILRLAGNRWTLARDLAARVNDRGRYRKRDGSLVSAWQVRARARQYLAIFERDGSWMRLRPA